MVGRENILNHIWAYFLVLISVSLQGELAILAAAGAASVGYLNPVGVFLTAAFGNILSDVLWYLLGYYSRVDWLIKRFHRLGITSEKVDLAKRIVMKDVVRFLIVGKLTNWMMIPALIATGVAKVPWKRWLVLIILSDLVIAAIFTPLGFYMASSLLKIQNGLRYSAIGFTILIFLIVLYSFRRILSRYGYLKSEDWDENQG